MGLFVGNSKNFTVHINKKNHVIFHEDTWVWYLLNESLFKETIPEIIKYCFGDPVNPIETFDKSNQLCNTITSSKTTRRVYIKFFI